MKLSKVNPQTVSSDFKVDLATGVGYMSRRELSRRLGVSHTAINKQVSTLQPNAGAALDDFLVAKVSTHFLVKGLVKEREFVEQLLCAGARAFIYAQVNYNPLVPKPDRLHEPCVPIRWLAQHIGRSRASVNRTINVSILRLRDHKVSNEVQFVNGERCVSPALILCSSFTGKNMQAARGLMLELTETDALPPTDVLLKLASLPTT